jgi:putative transcriptional regulator
MFAPLAINREALTIMGVPFPDLKTLENTAKGICSNMYEGYVPTRRGIEIVRDYCLGKMTLEQFVVAAKEKRYEE